MAMTNRERVGKAMGLLREGLAPFVERQVQSAVKAAAVRPALFAARHSPSSAALVAESSSARWRISASSDLRRRFRSLRSAGASITVRQPEEQVGWC